MLGEAIDRLIEANLKLWHLEDERRDPGSHDRDRLQAADNVSIWNRKRNETIDEINRILSQSLTAQNSEKPETTAILLTGSLGDLIDRLAIAKIRHYHLTEAAADGSRLNRVADEIIDLKLQIDQAARAGVALDSKERQRLFGFGKNKSYKNEETTERSS